MVDNWWNHMVLLYARSKKGLGECCIMIDVCWLWCLDACMLGHPCIGDFHVQQSYMYWGRCTTLESRDVKMGFNPWANLAHHEFEPGWVEKNSTFSKVDWTQPDSLNPRVKRVRAGLKVGWPT